MKAVIKLDAMGTFCIFKDTDEMKYDIEGMLEGMEDFKVSFIEMSEEEFKNLAEFDGW